MIKPFDFYFDFISPYSFLAHKEIRKIEKKASVKIKYKPILLGGLHNLHGIFLVLILTISVHQKVSQLIHLKVSKIQISNLFFSKCLAP